MEENRKFKRVNLAEHPEVYDAHTNELLGRIVDISTGGFKIIASNEMEEGKLYVLNISLMERNNKKKMCWSYSKCPLVPQGYRFWIDYFRCHLVQIDALERLDLDSLMRNKPKHNEDI